ncbi:hypothetical protein F9K33_04880 [bacterium]|nr:MAG: hypothetical protein F9K33_04880 [bacterium]
MKTSLFSSIMYCAIFYISSFQTSVAQNCDSFYPIKKGNSFEMQEFDGNNKLTGTNTVVVKDRRDMGGTVEATLQGTYMNAKGKTESSVEFKVKCDGSIFFMDLQSFFSSMEKQKDMELKLEGGFSEMPIRNINVGDQLKDAVMKMHMMQEGEKMGTMVMTIRRKVEAKQSVTVPAGTFECYKIAVESESAMEMMGMKMPGGKSHSVDYFSPGIGTVKNEAYDKKGKLMHYSVLSKITK